MRFIQARHTVGSVSTYQSSCQWITSLFGIPSSPWSEHAPALALGARLRDENWPAGRGGLSGCVPGAPPGGQMSPDSKPSPIFVSPKADRNLSCPPLLRLWPRLHLLDVLVPAFLIVSRAPPLFPCFVAITFLSLAFSSTSFLAPSFFLSDLPTLQACL